MKTSTNLKIAELSLKLKDLVQKTSNLLNEVDNKELQARLLEEMEVLKNRTELKVAFVGQYSSGKSTIISALTGNRNINIDANVATDVVSEYKWNNIILMDTPGIMAGKVEQHDERTKVALKECDLIAYVLTSQLFDEIIFNNFINLAYEQRLSDKILIVVNKMSMEDGDFDDLVNNYTFSITQVFKERGYEFNFPIVFIDAADFIEGQEDDDEEFIQLSNFNHFIGVLNDFVKEKGLIKKQFDTPVRMLKSYVADIAISEANPQLVALSDQYTQKFKKSLRDVERMSTSLLSTFEIDASNEAYNVMTLIGEAGKEQLNLEVSKLEKWMDDSVAKLTTDIEEFANSEYNELLTELDEFEHKEAFVLYQERMDQKIKSPSISIEERNNLEKQKELFHKLFPNAATWGPKLTGWASNGEEGLKGLSQASGSKMHEFVLQAGHKMGHKFVPWEAVKITSKIGKFAKYGIPVIATGITIGLDLYAAKQEETRRNEIIAAKQQFSASCDSTIRGVRNQIEGEIRNTIIANFKNKLAEIDQIKIEISNTTKRNNEIMAKLDKLDSEYVDFIEIIEA